MGRGRKEFHNDSQPWENEILRDSTPWDEEIVQGKRALGEGNLKRTVSFGFPWILDSRISGVPGFPGFA